MTRKKDNNNNDEKKKITTIDKIIMEHHSIIYFNTATNKEYVHKIILDECNNRSDDNEWIGITFRLSKSFVHFIDGVPHLHGDKILRMATTEEVGEFRKLKSRENFETDFNYPEINYTISKSDLMMIHKSEEIFDKNKNIGEEIKSQKN